MEILRILLDSETRAGDILSAIKKIRAEKIVFVCPRDFPLLTDISILKKFRETAREEGIAIAFVCPQKFLRDVLKSQKFEVYSTVVKELQEVKERTLADCLKPKSADALPQAFASKEIEKEEKKPIFSTHPIDSTQEKNLRGKFFFGFLIVIGLLGMVWAWVSPRAMIVIKPKISAIPVTQNFLLTFPEPLIPEKEENLPRVTGIFVQSEVAGTETFPSTGRRYDLTNARGRVTLFNETSQTKYFMPSRLQAPNGAIFRFLEAVEIPPRSTEGPGRQSVQVVADEYDEEKKPIGDRGNIDAGTELFFPALRPESRELWYAKANLGPLVGGSTLTHYFLQDNEFERVQEVLIETLRVRAVDQLRAEIANRSLREKKKYVLLDDPRLLKAELLQADFPAGLIGQELQTFQVPGRIKVSGIVFDQQEVVHFLTEKLRQRQDNRKKLLHLDQQSTEYEVLELEPLDIGKWLKLSVEMQGIETLDMESDALSAIEWRDNLRREIAGKKLSEAQSILTNFADIERVLNLEISPFWADQLPKLHDRIHFEIQN